MPLAQHLEDLLTRLSRRAIKQGQPLPRLAGVSEPESEEAKLLEELAAAGEDPLAGFVATPRQE